MKRLKIEDWMIKAHKAMNYEPIKELLGRLSRHLSGRVFKGKRPADSKKLFKKDDQLIVSGDDALRYIKALYKWTLKFDITTAKPEMLMKVVRDEDIAFIQREESKSERTPLFSALSEVFNYNGFREAKSLVIEEVEKSDDIYFHWAVQQGGKGRAWGAHRFIKGLKVRYCPYCNADTVYSSVFWRVDSGSGEKVINSELDHFMPKSKYPFLALSLYNLIPSCRRCNGSIKGSEDITFENCLYPYRDDMHQWLKFSFDPKRYAAFHGVGEDRNVALDIHATALDGLVEKDRAERFLKAFMTREVYQTLFASEIIDEIRKMNERSTLLKVLIERDGHNLSEESLRKLILHRCLDPEEINEHRFSKVFIDLLQGGER